MREHVEGFAARSPSSSSRAGSPIPPIRLTPAASAT
jgi:hypothetical protein